MAGTEKVQGKPYHACRCDALRQPSVLVAPHTLQECHSYAQLNTAAPGATSHSSSMSRTARTQASLLSTAHERQTSRRPCSQHVTAARCALLAITHIQAIAGHIDARAADRQDAVGHRLSPYRRQRRRLPIAHTRSNGARQHIRIGARRDRHDGVGP